MSTTDQHPWGRVDETGAVYVRTPDGERVVGEYPDATPEEALAYFERKYADLAGPLLDSCAQDVRLVMVGGVPRVARPDLAAILENHGFAGEEMKITHQFGSTARPRPRPEPPKGGFWSELRRKLGGS